MIVATANDRAVTAKERSRSPIGHATKGDAIGHRLFGRLFPASVCRDRSFAVTGMGELCYWRLLDDLLAK